MSSESKNYNYYAESIVKVMVQHDLIMPDQESEFVRFVRGC